MSLGPGSRPAELEKECVCGLAGGPVIVTVPTCCLGGCGQRGNRWRVTQGRARNLLEGKEYWQLSKMRKPEFEDSTMWTLKVPTLWSHTAWVPILASYTVSLTNDLEQSSELSVSSFTREG